MRYKSVARKFEGEYLRMFLLDWTTDVPFESVVSQSTSFSIGNSYSMIINYLRGSVLFTRRCHHHVFARMLLLHSSQNDGSGPARNSSQSCSVVILSTKTST